MLAVDNDELGWLLLLFHPIPENEEKIWRCLSVDGR